MINDKVIELINRDLDGTLSQKEKAQLERHLESDTEAREMLAKLQLLHAKLYNISEVEPPAELKEGVMTSLPVVRFSAGRHASPAASKIIELFHVPKFQMAGMFSLGAAAALLFLIFTQNLSDSSQASSEKAIGTILAPEKTGNVVQIDSKQITIEDYRVEINTSRSEDIVFVNISLKSESNQTVQLVVTSEASANFKFHALDYSAPNLIYASFGNDFFSAAIAGPGNWVLAFDDPAKSTETLKIELKTDSNSVTEHVAIQELKSRINRNETLPTF